MSMNRKLTVLTLVTIAAAGCSDSAPDPGTMDVFLVSPNNRESAMVVELDGVFEDVTGPSTAKIYSAVVDGRTRVIVLMRSPGQVRFEVFVPDMNDPPVGQVVEVAGPRGELRDNADQFSLRFEIPSS